MSTPQGKPPRGARTPSKRRWLEIYATVPFEYVEPVASLFQRYGESGVVIEEAGGHNPDEGEQHTQPLTATVRTYLPVTQRYRRSRELVHIGLALIAQMAEGTTFGEREVAEQEWEEAWKAHFTPLRIGQRIVLRPPWDEESGGPDDAIVVIDPGLAFGTGHHPTTRMTLECMERLLTAGCSVLDVGSGSGILGIAAAKLGAGAVLGVEIDKVAVRSSKANVRANGVARTVRFYEGSLPHERVERGAADVALANISAKALIELAPHLRDALRDGGSLVASGMLTERVADVRSAFEAARLSVGEEHVDGDWAALVATAG